MPDSSHDSPIGVTDDDTSQLASRRLSDAAVSSRLDTILDLDEILSAAHLAERRVEICMDGRLQAEYNAVIAELNTLIDVDGKVIATGEDDDSLAEVSRAEALNAQERDLRRRMSEVTYSFLVRAMPTDEWEAWDAARRGPQRRIKDQKAYENELLAACLVSPQVTVDDVANKLRPKLNQGRLVALFNAAFSVNATDGLDLEK